MTDSKKRARDETSPEGCTLITFVYDDGTCNYTTLRFELFADKEDAEERLLDLAYAAKYCGPRADALDLDDHSLETYYKALLAAHPDKAGRPRTDVNWGALLSPKVQENLRSAGGFKIVERCGACLRHGYKFTYEADDGGAQPTMGFSAALAPPPPLAEDVRASAPAAVVDAATSVSGLSED